METIKKCVIKAVFKSDKNKEGKPFIDKKGKGYWKVAVKVDDEQEWRSCLVFNKEDRAMVLQTGDEVTLKLFTSPDGKYKNFEVPTKKEIEFLELKKTVDQLVLTVGDMVRERNGQEEDKTKGYHYPTRKEEGLKEENEIKPEDIPF